VRCDDQNGTDFLKLDYYIAGFIKLLDRHFLAHLYTRLGIVKSCDFRVSDNFPLTIGHDRLYHSIQCPSLLDSANCVSPGNVRTAVADNFTLLSVASTGIAGVYSLGAPIDTQFFQSL